MPSEVTDRIRELAEQKLTQSDPGNKEGFIYSYASDMRRRPDPELSMDKRSKIDQVT